MGYITVGKENHEAIQLYYKDWEAVSRSCLAMDGL